VIESMSKRIRSLDEEFTKLKKNKIELLQVFVDIDRTCDFVLEEAKNSVNADNGSIMLYGEREKNLVIKAAFGTVWEPKTSLGRGEGIAGDVLSTGKAELINNVSMDTRFKTGSADIMSMLCAPLKGKNTPFGVINMSRNTGQLFTVEDLKLLRTVAIYASIAIENAMHFARLHDVTDEFLRHASLLDIW
jgi:GAF domain-containing protein